MVRNGYRQLPIKENTRERVKNTMKRFHTYDYFINVLIDIYYEINNEMLGEWFESNYSMWYTSIESVGKGKYECITQSGERETVAISVLSSDVEADTIFCIVNDAEKSNAFKIQFKIRDERESRIY